jgi:hypothetical protein
MRFFTFVVFLAFGILFNLNATAQNLELSDIKKIELTIQPGGMTNDFRSREIVFENDSWKCYQTRLIQFNLNNIINDSSRRFVRVISTSILTSLLNMINKPDTAIGFNLFNISKDDVVKYMDSLAMKLPLSEQTKLAEIIRSNDTVVNKALYTLYFPRFKMGDDRTSTTIKITTLNNEVKIIYATSFGYLDFEPWRIINTNAISYNPHIALAFETLSGNGWYSYGWKKRVLLALDRAIYYEVFGARIK